MSGACPLKGELSTHSGLFGSSGPRFCWDSFGSRYRLDVDSLADGNAVEFRFGSMSTSKN